LEIVQVGVHDQLWQKPLWKETAEFRDRKISFVLLRAFCG
jgi:hypothetical protein